MSLKTSNEPPKAEASRSDFELSQCTTILVDFSDQMYITTLAMVDRIVHLHRRTRMICLDLRDAFVAFTKQTKKSGKKTLLDAIKDISSVKEAYELDVISLQEFYFGIAVLMFALSLGGIVGNLWHEIMFAPKLDVKDALLIIFLLPLKIWTGASELTNVIRERRAALYIILFTMGFSLGRLCNYSLLTTAPRMIAPLLLANLIRIFGLTQAKSKEAPTKGLVGSKVLGTRLELFMVISVLVYILTWILYLCTGILTFGLFLKSFFCNAMVLGLLFAHFQLFYYGVYTLREKWGTESMHESHYSWNLESVNPWVANADLGYALAALILDVVMAVLQF